MIYVLARLVQDNGLNKEKGRSMLQLLPIYVFHGSIPVNSSNPSSPHPSPSPSTSDLRPLTLDLSPQPTTGIERLIRWSVPFSWLFP